ncbi:hypothetical protein C3K47_15245 [Solitalea longa]|uniref:Outer membrane protein beta-barrel domain-containing protein n=1 Tax=Solitalea longa TaxID=2079460 RepID=A0A2S4ZYI9_9SPHI|nr:hypothetical protein [Solitalea longa]POY35414.1 hypothetical protein C3K47_15245 [Solitalea longa]
MSNFKPVTIFIFLLFVSIAVKAQDISPYKFSLGLNVMSYNQQLPITGSDFNDNNYVANYINGLVFKVRNNLFLWRSGFQYNRYEDNNSTAECATCPQSTGKYETFRIGAGFEKEYFYGKVRPILGLDLFYYRSDYKGNSAVGTANEILLTNNRNGAGYSPFVGIKIFPVDFITLTATTSFAGIWYHESIKSEQVSTGIRTTTPGDYHYDSIFNPVAGLTITYNFGSQD